MTATMKLESKGLAPAREEEGFYAPLQVALDLVAKKREEELIRFHTCCADPRASK
ncbi:hypothetical protein [Bauldia litoralis]|uniref:Uncharacterized protein n=1 Tax=Bauldia litoralis TaxID=665467 RepID=A0A1G6EMZ2_9HYPH|nr:hypothetical protein [Bauldia litoralis]SDB58893.1 hypothetical protein SAMN02982931_04748 [Bauldia litoralis]